MRNSRLQSDGTRLHKRIAESGLCSRRAAEVMIEQGRVQVNGTVVREMGVKVQDEDVILVDGSQIAKAKIYTLVLNKPPGYVTTLSDPQGRATVKRLLPDLGVQLKPVGRLDKESEGLLIFTNDGELAHRLTHPSYGIEKEYEVLVEGEITDAAVKRLREGVHLEESGKTAPAKVEVNNRIRGKSKLTITIHEGRKRQVRLMCDMVGFPVETLKRTRIGPLYVKGLTRGECRMLGMKEVETLRKLVKLSD